MDEQKRRTKKNLEAWAEPLSQWLVEESVRRQYELVYSSLPEDLSLIDAAYRRLKSMSGTLDPASVAMAARGMASVALTMASRMEWCAAFSAGARATLTAEAGEMPTPRQVANWPTEEAASAARPFVRDLTPKYVMTEEHRLAVLEGQRRAREARRRAAQKSLGSGPEA